MARERTYQTEAVILRRRNWGEADRILTLFTPQRGKVRVRAVGVRKPRSRQAAYRLIVRTLGELSGGGNPGLVLRCYDLKLLECTGYRPELTLCTVGGEDIRAEDQFFSPARGGAVCPHCADRAEGRFPVSMAALRVLRHIQRCPLEEALKLTVRKETLDELEHVLQRYIQYVLESPLRSRNYLTEVSQPRGERGV